jgi:hypothetical protein
MTELQAAIAKTERVTSYAGSGDARAAFAALVDEYRLEIQKRQSVTRRSG